VSLASQGDFEAARAALAAGSQSFHFAWRLLPARLRDPFAAFYAFCRTTDDAIDESDDPARALGQVKARTDRIFALAPDDAPIDRAFAEVVRAHALPRAPVDALIDGYRWDVEARVIATESDLVGYAVRVAASVGVVTTYLMGSRDVATLARAADLGVAMQLTNVARDVGEDARRGRVYLPDAWLAEEGLSRTALVSTPRHTPSLGRVVRRTLDLAEVLYVRAEPGIQALPSDCRPAIRAASRVYREIGRVVAENGYDAVSRRASTSTARKLLALAGTLAPSSVSRWNDPPLAEATILLRDVA
jgi:phytoene synthase